MSKAKAVLAASLLAVGLICVPPAEVQGQPKDKIIKSSKLVISSAEAMRYPSAARAAGIQGRVVIQVELNDTGQVVSAAASPDQAEKTARLVEDAATNAKQWRFRSHRAGKAEIIYDFALVGECNPAETEWSFVFLAPNAAEITDCATRVWVTATQKQEAAAVAGEVRFLSFERMKYPPLAATARIRGEVLVRAELAADGTVVSTTVIAGHPMLAAAAASNLRKWRFQPSAQKEITMVYTFQFGGTVCPDGGLGSDFDFEPPNHVTVTGCSPMVNP